MDITTKYITLNDFKVYFGIDLDATLRDDANPSNKGQAFLKRIEDRMATWLDYNYYQNVDLIYPTFNNYQKLHYQRALLEQAIYVFRNGDLSVDSGYDLERGNIGNTVPLAIAPNAIAELALCGIACRDIGNRSCGNGWFGGFWY